MIHQHGAIAVVPVEREQAGGAGFHRRQGLFHADEFLARGGSIGIGHQMIHEPQEDVAHRALARLNAVVVAQDDSSLGAMITRLGIDASRQSQKLHDASAHRRRRARRGKGENDMQILQANIVQNLVIATLQKSRINRHDGHQAFGRHTGSKSHRVLLGDADVIGASGNFARRLSMPVPLPIAAVMPTTWDFLWRGFNQRLGKDIGVARDRPFVFFPFAGQNVKRRYTVYRWGPCRPADSLCLFWSARWTRVVPSIFLYVLQSGNHFGDIMAVMGPTY